MKYIKLINPLSLPLFCTVVAQWCLLISFASYVWAINPPASLSVSQVFSISSATQTFTVTNVNDSGAGSLRQAITDANATPGADVINFSIGSGPKTLLMGGPYPVITQPLTIDATTQPGFAGTPIIQLKGDGTFDGLTISAGSCVVQGLVLTGFDLGIKLSTAGNNTIRGNYIGIDISGTAVIKNRIGIYLDSSSNNRIGGSDAASRNVISGSYIGIHMIQGQFNQVLGNYIGTDASGTAPLGNGTGIQSESSSNNTYGGSEAGARNLISANYSGLNIFRGNFNQVLGNYIGPDASGMSALPGSNQGLTITEGSNNVIGGNTTGARNIISGNATEIVIGGNDPPGPYASNNRIEGNYIGTNAMGTARLGDVNGGGIFSLRGTNNIIGGDTPGLGNVISGNSDGIHLLGGADNVIKGNYIGTDASGTFAISNPGGGIVIISAWRTIIGGNTTGSRNVISGNGNQGILIYDSLGATGTQVQGNYIGTQADGISPLGNASHGVFISNNANESIIGGIGAGARNIIAYNGGAGVANDVASQNQMGFPRLGNIISGNKIFSNGALGIDFRHDGVTPNDPEDSGNFGAQNFPVVTAAQVVTGGTRIVGTLNTRPNASYTIEFFSNLNCDASGYGEGERYLGTTTVSTDSTGNAQIDVTIPLADTLGSFITTTATNATKDTSEFSKCVQVADEPLPSPPALLTEENSTRGVALDSVTLVRDPLPVITSHNFSSDQRTRVVIFAQNVNPQSAYISTLTAAAEDSNGTHSLLIEYVGTVPGFPAITQIVVKLPDELSQNGDVNVYITLRGQISNKVLLGIRAP